jgi:hypothetical protein
MWADQGYWYGVPENSSMSATCAGREEEGVLLPVDQGEELKGDRLG